MRELGVQPQAWAPLCEGMKNIFTNKTLAKIGKKSWSDPDLLYSAHLSVVR